MASQRQGECLAVARSAKADLYSLRASFVQARPAVWHTFIEHISTKRSLSCGSPQGENWLVCGTPAITMA
jgi:hypothetical protein